MKRIVCAVVAAGLLAAAPLAARADESAQTGTVRGERAEKMLKEHLGLSDDQAVKLKAAWKVEKDATKSLREQSKEESRKLEEEVRALASDKDIQATLDQLDANRKAMTAERQKLEASVASILKPYQRAKMRLMLAERLKLRARWSHGVRDGADQESTRRKARKYGASPRLHDDD